MSRLCLPGVEATKGLKNWLKVKVPRLEEERKEREKRRMRRPNDVERIQVANVMIWQIREHIEGHDHDRQGRKGSPSPTVSLMSGAGKGNPRDSGILHRDGGAMDRRCCHSFMALHHTLSCLGRRKLLDLQ